MREEGDQNERRSNEGSKGGGGKTSIRVKKGRNGSGFVEWSL